MRPRFSLWALVVVTGVAYPLSALGGGAPRFPSRAECIHPARTDGDIEAVFGRFTRQDAADATLARVLGLGFTGTQIEGDGCGILKVDVHGIPTLAVGRQFAVEAQKAGLHVTLEKVTP